MKAVGESMQVPLLYYKNNLVGTINLLEVSGGPGSEPSTAKGCEAHKLLNDWRCPGAQGNLYLHGSSSTASDLYVSILRFYVVFPSPSRQITG
jgi:hypothetical protein